MQSLVADSRVESDKLLLVSAENPDLFLDVGAFVHHVAEQFPPHEDSCHTRSGNLNIACSVSQASFDVLADTMYGIIVTERT